MIPVRFTVRKISHAVSAIGQKQRVVNPSINHGIDFRKRYFANAHDEPPFMVTTDESVDPKLVRVPFLTVSIYFYFRRLHFLIFSL